MTVALTLLTLAPAEAVMAADAPETLKIKGYTVNNQENWTAFDCNSKSDDGLKFYFHVSLTNGKAFKFVDGTNQEWGPGGNAGGQEDKTIYVNTPYTLTQGNAAYKLDYNDRTDFKITVDFSGATPKVQVATADNDYPEIEQPKPAEVPEALYIIGHVEGTTAWSTCLPGEKSGDTFSFTNIRFIGYDASGRSTFAFSTVPDGKGTSYYATSDGNDIRYVDGRNYMTLNTAGGWEIYGNGDTYDLTVDFSDPDNPWFTVKIHEDEFVPGSVPETFYMIGQIGTGDWQTTGNSFAFTTRDEEAGTITFAGVDINGTFAFCTQFGESDTADICKEHDGYYGPTGDEDKNVAEGERKYLYGKTGRGYNPSATGQYTVTVYFPAEGDPWFRMTKLAEWYFVGDLNNWYSYEFTDDNAEKTLSAELFNATKKNWQFVPAEDPALAAEGWYQFSGFPLVDGIPTLSGQFKIKDGAASWSGNEYVHPVNVYYPNEDGNTDPGNFSAYNLKPLPASEIGTGQPFSGDVLVKKADKIAGNGGNLHFQCNAVQYATIYFNPSIPSLRIDGDPVDYFIFYSRDKEEGNEDVVVGRINSDKPNSNNYYLPGTNYGNGAGTLPNPAGGEHMNIGEGKTFNRIELKDKTGEEIMSQLLALYGEKYEYSKVNQKTFSDLAYRLLLPNLESLADRDYLYIEKIPNGFASPAGTNFNMTLTKSLDTESKLIPKILEAKHIYILPVCDAVHVHVNADNLRYAGYEAPKISYRVYYTDEQYNRYVIGNTHMWPQNLTGTEESPMLISSGSTIPKTGTDADPYVENQWVELSDYRHQSEWGATAATHHKGEEYEYWNVRYTGEEDGGLARAETDPRLGVRSRYANAYVQFRVELVPTDASKPAILNYFPDRLDVTRDDFHFPMGGSDLYLVMNNDDGNGVWTGIEIIEADGDGPTETLTDSNAPVEYYTLQGVRVSNPTGGLYIMVKGGKSKKVYL